MSSASKGLGKGLSALMGEDYAAEHTITNSPEATAEDAVQFLDIAELQPGKYQPRKYFEETSLQELSESIKTHGIMQPILVRPINPEDRVDGSSANFEIIAGERRWRAAKMAALAQVPVLIRRLEEAKRLEFALIENVQRQDLNIIEEAEGYRALMDSFKYTQEQLSDIVGKSRSHIANCLRMISLPDTVKTYLKDGEISAGHARAILKAEEPANAAKLIIEHGLNVRQIEDYVKTGLLPWEKAQPAHSNDTGPAGQSAAVQQPQNDNDADVSAGAPKQSKARQNVSQPKQSQQTAPEKSGDIIALEEALMDHLGMHVDIVDEDEQGQITIHYQSLTELDDILKRLGGSL
jgi:ParB family chromosome partitioning protein